MKLFCVKSFFPSSAIAQIAHVNQQSNSGRVTLFRNLNDLIPDRRAFEVIARGIAESAATESESATTPDLILLYRVTHHVAP